MIVEKTKIREIIGTSTVKGVYVSGSSLSGSSIFRNNFISLSGTTNLTSGTIYGLDYWGYASNSLEAYNNSIYIGGTDVTTGSTYAFALRDDATTFKAYNNAVFNARSNSTGTGKHYAIYVSDTNQVTREIDYNDFYVNGTGGVFGYYQGIFDIADLTTWQDTTGLDEKSVSGNPGFVGGDDLHVLTSQGTLDAKAFYFASVPDDIDGDTRNLTTPDIGADEYTYVPPAVPIFSIAPTSKDYGTVNLGSSSASQTFTITNVGVGTLTISSAISITGTDASQFILTDGNTYPINLAATESATIGVVFTPTTAGAKTADIQIVDNTTDATHLVPLTGTGFDVTVTTFPYSAIFRKYFTSRMGTGCSKYRKLVIWNNCSYAALNDHTTGTGYFAWIDDSSPYNANPSSLLTPPFNISALTTPVASFYYWIGRGNAGPSTLHVDVYNGTTWTNDVITALVENNMWQGIDIDLTAYKSAATKVRFRAYENTAYFNCDISLDDFSVIR